ncbi:MAG: nucleotide sugar dehydrogenase, partial [Rhodothermales bacterium]
PERIDPGNQQFTTTNTPVVVGGVTNACTELACLAMQQVVALVHPVSSPKVAEMEKLLENIFRSVNIALVNELARLCDRMGGISIWEVVEAAATKPFGYMPFYPGPGLGGHCIPIDPYYLSWLARRYDFETNFITLSARTNEAMPFYVVDAVVGAVAEQPIRLEDAKVLVLGVAFKKDVDDVRHSPALKVMALLRERGVGQLDYSDPHVPILKLQTSGSETEYASVDVTEETLQQYSVVVILTDHSAFPYATIAKHARALVDTRNALKHIPHNRDKVALLGGGDF